MDWAKLLHWSEEELEDLRFVGYSYVQQGAYEVAITIFLALVVVSKHNVYDLQTIGGLYLQIGDNLQALDYLDRSLAIAPDHYPSLLNHAKALFALGYKRRAYLQVKKLEKCNDPQIAKKATALRLGFS